MCDYTFQFLTFFVNEMFKATVWKGSTQKSKLTIQYKDLRSFCS